MEQEINQILTDNNILQNSKMREKLEQMIQKSYNINVPSIILEYLSEDDIIFELSDLTQFYKHFGEVDYLKIDGKENIVLFRNFFSANICIEFLNRECNYKNNMKDSFNVRWFDFNSDLKKLPHDVENLYRNINNSNIANLRESNFDNSPMNMLNQNKPFINMSNINQMGNSISSINNINNINVPPNNMKLINQNPIVMNPKLQYLQPNLLIQYSQINKNIQMNNKNNSSNINNINNMQQNQSMQNFSFPGMNLPPQVQKPIQNGFPVFMGQNINNINNINSINQINTINNINNINSINQINNINNINSVNNLLPNNSQQLNNILNNNQFIKNQRAFNQNLANNNNNEEKNGGKCTCKYEILISNDKDFQIARRLIGSKGCNMKKIINECSSRDDKDIVKLRLRGQGSGYKEGPQNKESDEPLHLCISAKNPEKMKKACILVDELLSRIKEEYKLFCEKNNISPIDEQIARKIENRNSFHKMK